MSLEAYIENIPKVELGLRFEGCIPKPTLLMMAELNERHHEKSYTKLVSQWDDFDLETYFEHVPTMMSWIVYPDDLTRCVYDTAVSLSKQNIRYAELGINPLLFMQSGMSFEQLANALSDGADRAKRGWNIELRWILTIPADEPRKSDEILRWSNSATGRKNGVVGIGLLAHDAGQSLDPFERMFRNAEKKALGRVVYAGLNQTIEFAQGVANLLEPERVVATLAVPEESDETPEAFEYQALLVVNPAEALANNVISDLSEFSIDLYKGLGKKLAFTLGEPSLHEVTLANYFESLVSVAGFTVDDLDALILNGLDDSFMNEEEVVDMRKSISRELAELKGTYLQAESSEN